MYFFSTKMPFCVVSALLRLLFFEKIKQTRLVMFDDNDNTNLPPNINVCRGWTQIASIFAKIF